MLDLCLCIRAWIARWFSRGHTVRTCSHSGLRLLSLVRILWEIVCSGGFDIAHTHTHTANARRPTLLCLSPAGAFSLLAVYLFTQVLIICFDKMPSISATSIGWIALYCVGKRHHPDFHFTVWLRFYTLLGSCVNAYLVESSCLLK